jgi:predicted transcriptional regulator of viral defense system
MAETARPGTRRPLTQLETALAEQLRERGWPLITPYGLFHELRALYMSGRRLRQRKHLPDAADLAQRRRNLVRADVLTPDPDYGHRAYRIVANSDRAAEEICCLVDRYCYVAHLSAMARYGLTDRRPAALHLRAPERQLARGLLADAMIQDYGEDTLAELEDDQILRPHTIAHPATVRGRTLALSRTRHPGESLPIRGTHARIATIGQTFADMLEEPEACGGMAHILEVWREHAALYLEDIIPAVGRAPHAITKVRAGYILDELLEVSDQQIQAWTRHAQRGSSRRLDPERPFAPTYSEKWMLSINVN